MLNIFSMRKEGLSKESFFRKFTEVVAMENLCERVQWLIYLRWIAGSSVIVGLLILKAFFDIHNIIIPMMLGLAILLYNTVFYRILRYLIRNFGQDTKACKQRRIRIINYQIFLDLVVLASLVYYTGGISNPLLFFFIFHMVISSILLSRVNAYLWAIFTMFMVAGISYLEYRQIIPSQSFFPFIPPETISNIGYLIQVLTVFSLTLIITVYFATTIMRPIRKKQLDLTELKDKLQDQKDQLEQKNIELEELDKSKTDFLYRVEHELKAPIDAIQGLLSIVTRGYDSVDHLKKRELLSRAEIRVAGMREMVSDLLSLSRIDARSFHLERQPVKLQEVIEEVAREFKGYAKQKGIKVRLDLAREAPSLYADREAVEEIVRNIIHNAIKYSFQGEVKVRLESVDGQLETTVSDEGIGIGEEDLANIFREFYRSANAKAFEEGSGLGLALVKRLVEQHGGTIHVSSQLNRGTTCTVRMPLK